MKDYEENAIQKNTEDREADEAAARAFKTLAAILQQAKAEKSKRIKEEMEKAEKGQADGIDTDAKVNL